MREMSLKNEFENWLVKIDGKSQNTAQQYKSSINSISRHYSKCTNKMIDIYNINDISFIKGLVKDYGLDGKHQIFGQNGNSKYGHATIRNAIAAYARFIEYKNSGNKDKFDTLISLWKIYNKANELLTKAIGGTEVEEFAKMLLAKYYNAEPLTISNKNADLKTINNKLIQVKSRKVDIITAIPLGVIRNWDFDILVVILFSRNGDILKAIEINAKNAKNILKWDNYQKGYILTTSKDLLQNENSIDITKNLQKLINVHSQIEEIFEQINSKDELKPSKPSDNNREEQEIKKVKRRIYGWLMKNEQKNSRILYAFIKLYENNNGIVTYEKLEKETGIKRFESNFNQMKNFGPQNNGKVFEQEGIYVHFWEKVENIIWDAYKRYCKN